MCVYYICTAHKFVFVQSKFFTFLTCKTKIKQMFVQKNYDILKLG